MLEQLFKFPVVMIDGDNEERKMKDSQKYGDLPSQPEEDYDIIYGEAEYPYWDFIGIEDRWLPNRESINRAMTIPPLFDACIVKFLNVGQLLVPWSKKTFKAKLIKFIEDYKAKQPESERLVKIKTISAEEYKKITDTDE